MRSHGPTRGGDSEPSKKNDDVPSLEHSSFPMRTLSLVKGEQQFCFRYQVGEEAKVLQSLIEMVNKRELPFDWFDAAVLSHQLGQHLAKELKAYLPKKGE